MAIKRQGLVHAPWELVPEQRDRIRVWAVHRWPALAPRLGGLWAACRDWHLANGVLRADWEATFRNWLRKEAEFSGMARPRTGQAEPTLLANEIQLLLTREVGKE